MLTSAISCTMESKLSIKKEACSMGTDEFGSFVRIPVGSEKSFVPCHYRISRVPMDRANMSIDRTTGFGIGRASSLGFNTDDLTCKSFGPYPPTQPYF